MKGLLSANRVCDRSILLIIAADIAKPLSCETVETRQQKLNSGVAFEFDSATRCSPNSRIDTIIDHCDTPTSALKMFSTFFNANGIIRII